MDIRADATIPFDREQVFAAYRDRLPELTDELPNIRRIEVLERKELSGGDVALVNEWAGGGEIPAIARSVIRESMLTWTDYATWHAESHSVSWRTVAHAFPDAIDASGTNRFVECADGTRVEIRGAVACDAGRIPAVPRWLQAKVGRTVEQVLVSRVGDNLRQVAAGLARWLAAERE